MRIKQYCIKDDEKDYFVKKILPKLFPELSSIEEKGNVVTFSKYKKGTFKRFISSLYDSDYVIRIHLFELLVYHVPRRLSYYRVGNYTFAPQYTSFIFSILLSEPKYLIPYFIREFNQIKSPYVEQSPETFFDILYSDESLENVTSNVEKLIGGLLNNESYPRTTAIFTLKNIT